MPVWDGSVYTMGQLGSSNYVDAVGRGRRSTGTVPQVPLAEVADAKARLLEQPGHGGGGRIEPVGHAAGGIALVGGEVTVDAEAGREAAGHHRRPAG